MASARQLAAAHRRSLKTIRAKLLDMAATWDEVDQYNMNRLQEAADELQAVSDDLLDSTEV